MQDERALAETVVATDFFGTDGLRDDVVPPAPEKYTLLRSLGRGGAGSVYLAKDVQLGRLVAIKYLNDARPAELERFFREARFAARLNNPSIVQVYEAGDVEGQPYIAMQYIAGGNLAGAALDVPAIVGVMRQVAGALLHAHDAGIVHRDIKPENILLDAEGRAFLTDFGIARDLRGELGATISRDGQILGTPALMSPEQARGDVQAIDARSDVYALGATLYATVTGRAPFTADNLVDLLHAVIHDEPPFPRRYRADLPRDLEAVILQCMRKRREERFGSMREVVAAFDRCQSRAAGPAPSPLWFTSFVRSRVAAAPPKVEAPLLEQDWRPALEAAQEIAAWDAQLYRVSGDLTRHFPRLDGLIARLGRVLEEQPATGWARFYRGVAWFRRGAFDRALEDMERSIDRVRDLAGAYFELGRLYLAIYLDDHRAAYRRRGREEPRGPAKPPQDRLGQAGIAFDEARRLKADLPEWQLRYAAAVGYLASGEFDACLSACDAMLENDPDLEDVWRLRGDALRACGGDPLPAYARALEVRRSYFDVWLAMAEVHLTRGQGDEARRCLEKALEINNSLAVAEPEATETPDARAWQDLMAEAGRGLARPSDLPAPAPPPPEQQ
jgi:tetratricopeptide (TPR) repeat protein